MCIPPPRCAGLRACGDGGDVCGADGLAESDDVEPRCRAAYLLNTPRHLTQIVRFDVEAVLRGADRAVPMCGARNGFRGAMVAAVHTGALGRRCETVGTDVEMLAVMIDRGAAPQGREDAEALVEFGRALPGVGDVTEGRRGRPRDCRHDKRSAGQDATPQDQHCDPRSRPIASPGQRSGDHPATVRTRAARRPQIPLDRLRAGYCAMS